MYRLEKKIALVTGAASGLGAAIARRLRAEGAVVVITDIDAKAGPKLAVELECDFYPHDVTEASQWRAVVSEIDRRHQELHILVNNAGIEGSFDAATPETTELANWRKVFAVNLDGVLLGCQAAIPLMRRSGGGAIINMSSIASESPGPISFAYATSKSALRHATTSIATHCAKDGSRIRCNSVHPGMVMTSMFQRVCEAIAKKEDISAQEQIDKLRESIPQGEFQTPEDVASAVVFLASDEARHITGAKLVIDGGRSCRY